MSDTQGMEGQQNPQDMVGGQKHDDPTNILDFSENKTKSSKRGNKKKKGANTGHD